MTFGLQNVIQTTDEIETKYKLLVRSDSTQQIMTALGNTSWRL